LSENPLADFSGENFATTGKVVKEQEASIPAEPSLPMAPDLFARLRWT